MMSDSRRVLEATLEKMTGTLSPQIDTEKLLKDMKYCDTSTVQVGGQTYTYVSLESVIGAIENSQLVET